MVALPAEHGRIMDLRQRLARGIRPLVYLGTNPISLVGVILTTSAGVTLVGFWAFEILRGGPVHPYAGIVLFLVLPGIFALGLVLMPAGLLWRWRRMRKRGELPGDYPPVRFSQRSVRNAAVFVVVATMLNVAILGTGSYRGVEYMDSPQFCGMTCHKVMAPEYSAYIGSPHSRVACVQCHIGPGASWFVRSKLSGARQLIAVARETYSRPIPSPVRELRPARETCEQCHWPRKFAGDKLIVRTKHADDEANTPLFTVLLMKIGGHSGRGAAGIHGRHLDETERVRYVSTDGRRQVIPAVSYLDDAGKMVDYLSEDAAGKPPAGGERRTMDCMDCHNRPTHAFDLPERAVDRALADGRISRALPFVRKKSVELLRADYPDRDAAARELGARLAEFYRREYPQVYESRRPDVEAAGAGIRDIYLRNIFPNMRVTWGTYPNNLGHEDFPGCFRCHDDKHRAADGRVITQDCNACHSVLAMEESNPKILADLGVQ
jgi:hypothetical protein